MSDELDSLDEGAALEGAPPGSDTGAAEDAGAGRERADAGTDALLPPQPRGLLAELRSMLLPLVPGALIVVATYFMWQDSGNKQGMLLSELSASEAGAACARIEQALDRRADAMDRIGAVRTRGDAAWHAAADSLVRADASLLAVAEYDSALAFQGVQPASARLLSVLDLRDDPTRHTALEVAVAHAGSRAVLVTTVALTGGARELLVCVPPPVARAGWLVGVVDVRDVLDEALKRSYRRGFSAAVREPPIRIYGGDFAGSGPGAEFARDDAVVRGPLVWSVQLWPGEELTKELESYGPMAVFLAGMVLAFVTAVLVYVWREGAKSL